MVEVAHEPLERTNLLEAALQTYLMQLVVHVTLEVFVAGSGYPYWLAW
jgi:hypothetical protein